MAVQPLGEANQTIRIPRFTKFAIVNAFVSAIPRRVPSAACHPDEDIREGIAGADGGKGILSFSQGYYT